MNAVIISVLEVLVVGFTVWGLFNEDRFVRFEKNIVSHFRRKGFKVIDNRKTGGKCA